MFKPKMLIIASSIGFALSLLIGLSSDVALTSTLLRAFISGMGCVLIAIGVSFVFQKFLPEINDVLQDTTKNTDEQTGSVVNVVIDDDESLQDDLDSSLYIPLPTDSNTPQQKSAVSGSKYKKQSEYSVAQSQKTESDEYADSQGVIVDENEGNYGYDGSSETASSKGKSANNSSAFGLDTLPDISAFVSDSVSELKQGVGISGESDADISAVATESGSNVDTKNMAHAIRTMLAREK